MATSYVNFSNWRDDHWVQSKPMTDLEGRMMSIIYAFNSGSKGLLWWPSTICECWHLSKLATVSFMAISLITLRPELNRPWIGNVKTAASVKVKYIRPNHQKVNMSIISNWVWQERSFRRVVVLGAGNECSWTILSCFLEATSRTQRIWVAYELHKKQVGWGLSLINIEARIYWIHMRGKTSTQEQGNVTSAKLCRTGPYHLPLHSYTSPLISYPCCTEISSALYVTIARGTPKLLTRVNKHLKAGNRSPGLSVNLDCRSLSASVRR